MIVFLDLETTGLDPVKDHILQLAMVVTDNAGARFAGVQPFQSDVSLTEAAAGRLYMNPFVRDMHRKTGLLGRLEADVTAGRLRDLATIEQGAVDYLRRPGFELPDKITIAGNSVHFDLAFLRHHMPDLAACFSHRIMDVSVLRMFEGLHGDGPIDGGNTNEHDALADVLCSIRQYQGYVARRKDLADSARTRPSTPSPSTAGA